jgi:hypothetical protein
MLQQKRERHARVIQDAVPCVNTSAIRMRLSVLPFVGRISRPVVVRRSSARMVDRLRSKIRASEWSFVAPSGAHHTTSLRDRFRRCHIRDTAQSLPQSSRFHRLLLACWVDDNRIDARWLTRRGKKFPRCGGAFRTVTNVGRTILELRHIENIARWTLQRATRKQ